MPSSCSSENNGCISCAPNLSLWSISALTSQSKVGYGCLDNQFTTDVYATMTENLIEVERGSPYFCTISGEWGNYTWIYNSITQFIYIIDKYGNIVILNTNKTDGNLNYIFTNPNQDATTTTTAIVRFRNLVNYESCPISIKSDDYCLYCGSECEGICYQSIDYPCPSWGDSSSSCTVATCSAISTCPYSYNMTTTISDIKNLSFFYDLCKSSVSTKISILESNNPQNCAQDTCGEGRDACWVAAGGFSIADNNLDDPNASSTTSQKLKFKIAAPKEGFSKTYKSISGRVIFYYGGTGGKTPCCDNDFDGTIAEERSYSISASSIFKDNYFAVDCGEFDNDDQSLVGETINICYTVDKIQFI